MAGSIDRRVARLEAAAGRKRPAPGRIVVTEVVVNDPDTGKPRERWAVLGSKWQAAGGAP